jgi:hypothetical protein
MKAPAKSYGRCANLGAALSKASCHVDAVMEVVINQPVKPEDPFTWRNLSGALQGLHEMKKEAPHLKAKIAGVEKDLEALRGLVYRTPGAKERIHGKYRDVLNGIGDLRHGIRELCSD